MRALVLFLVAILAAVSVSAGGKPVATGIRVQVPSIPINWEGPFPSPVEGKMVFIAGDEEPFSVTAQRLLDWNWVHYTLQAIVPAPCGNSALVSYDDGSASEAELDHGCWLVKMGTHDAYAPATDSIPPPPTDPKQWEEMHRSAVLTPGE